MTGLEINQKAQEYVSLPYATTIECEHEGESVCFLAVHPELPGCMAQGNTANEAIDNLKEAQGLYITSLVERGLDVPLPKSMVHTSVRISGNTFLINGRPSVEGVSYSRIETVQTGSAITFGASPTQGNVFPVLCTATA